MASMQTLLNYEVFDLPVPREIELQATFLKLRDGIDQYKAAADITAYLQGKVSESSDAHFSLMAGLMYGVLVSAERREEYFNYVSLLTKDSYQNFVELLGSIINDYYNQFRDSSKDNLMWTLERLAKIPHVAPSFADTVTSAMRQLHHASNSVGRNQKLLTCLAQVFESALEWLCKLPVAVAVFYKAVKVVGELYSPEMETVRVRYEKIALRIWQARKDDCKEIGTELVRVLQTVARIPTMKPIFDDLAQIAPNGKPGFWNLLNSAKCRVGGNMYLTLSVSPMVEYRLTYIMENAIDTNMVGSYMQWLLDDLGIKDGTEEQTLEISDWVRCIVVNFHGPKPLTTPKWYLIGWLLSSTHHPHARAQIKLSLLFDWLFYSLSSGYEPQQLFEPGFSLITRSLQGFTNISNELLDFLLITADNYDIERKSVIQANVRTAFEHLVRKHMLKSLDTLSEAKELSQDISTRLKALFQSSVAGTMAAQTVPEPTIIPVPTPPPVPQQARPMSQPVSEPNYEERGTKSATAAELIHAAAAATVGTGPTISLSVSVDNEFADWLGRETLTKFLEKPTPTALVSFIKKYSEESAKAAAKGRETEDRLKPLGEQLVRLSTAAIRENLSSSVNSIAPEKQPAAGFAEAVAEFGAAHTGSKITPEGRIVFRFLHQICQANSQVAMAVFHEVLSRCDKATEEGKAGLASNFKTLFRGLWDLKATKAVEEHMRLRMERFEFETAGEDLSLLARYFDEYVRDNLTLLRMLVQTCKYSHIHRIERAIEQHGARIIEGSLLNLIKQSLEWSSYDQILLWRIINAHRVSGFQTKQSLLYCLCYMTNTLSNIEEHMEFVDGLFGLFQKHFASAPDHNPEDLALVFGLGRAVRLHIYSLLNGFPRKQISTDLYKLIEHYLNHQEIKKLQDLVELVAVFLEVEEKARGNVVDSIRESKDLKISLKGVLQSTAGQIPPKTHQAVLSLVKV